MKRLFLAVAILFACVSVTMAQDVFVKGDKIGHIGFGVGDFLGGTGYKTTVPPVLISGEYGLTDALLENGKGFIGVGGYMAYAANKHTYSGNYGYKYSYFIIGGRGAFHYQFVDKLDTYAGAMLGYNVASASYFGDDEFSGAKADAGGVTYSTFIGARYYFAENIAAFAELGYGIAALELGLAFKF